MADCDGLVPAAPPCATRQPAPTAFAGCCLAGAPPVSIECRLSRCARMSAVLRCSSASSCVRPDSRSNSSNGICAKGRRPCDVGRALAHVTWVGARTRDVGVTWVGARTACM
eukprot:6558864-Prymnesium_polylepis.4